MIMSVTVRIISICISTDGKLVIADVLFVKISRPRLRFVFHRYRLFFVKGLGTLFAKSRK